MLVKELATLEVFDTAKWLASPLDLFHSKTIYFSEELNRKISKKNTDMFEKINKINIDRNIELFIWESCSLRELRLKPTQVKEFKPSKNIFKLLDSMMPANKLVFINLLSDLLNKDNEFFIYLMIIKHIKTLILVKAGINPSQLQSWQLLKLQKQASLWKMENLILFYNSLYKIDVGLKTSSAPFSLHKSLNILACYFL